MTPGAHQTTAHPAGSAVRSVLVGLLSSTQKSLVLNMYGYDDELTIHNNAVIAAETRAELDRNHDAMLKQMAAGRSAPTPAS